DARKRSCAGDPRCRLAAAAASVSAEAHEPETDTTERRGGREYDVTVRHGRVLERHLTGARRGDVKEAIVRLEERQRPPLLGDAPPRPGVERAHDVVADLRGRNLDRERPRVEAGDRDVRDDLARHVARRTRPDGERTLVQATGVTIVGERLP